MFVALVKSGNVPSSGNGTVKSCSVAGEPTRMQILITWHGVGASFCLRHQTPGPCLYQGRSFSAILLHEFAGLD